MTKFEASPEVYNFQINEKSSKLIENVVNQPSKVSIVKTLNLLKDFTVDEVNEKIMIKNGIAITKIQNNFNSKGRNNGFEELPEIKLPLPSHAFIGDDQWIFLSNLLTFDEDELNLLHSVFMLFQHKGSISPSKFWKVMRYLHNISEMSYEYLSYCKNSNTFKFSESTVFDFSPFTPSVASNCSVTESAFNNTVVGDSDNLFCMAGLMNEKSELGKLFFTQLDVHECGSLSFFEFAFALSIFCNKSNSLHISQVVFDALDFKHEEIIYYEDLEPLFETMPVSVHEDFYNCFSKLEKNHLNFEEFNVFWDLNFSAPFINFFELDFDDVCYKFSKL